MSPKYRFPCSGIWHWEEKPPEHLALKARGSYVHRSSTGLSETETPLLKGAHRLLHALGPRAKQKLHRNLGQTCLWFLKDLLGKQGVTVVLSGRRTVEAKILGTIISMNPSIG